MSCHNILLVLFLHKNYYRNHRGQVHRPENVDQSICPYDPSKHKLNTRNRLPCHINPFPYCGHYG